jgi:hypothetical protein
MPEKLIGYEDYEGDLAGDAQDRQRCRQNTRRSRDLNERNIKVFGECTSEIKAEILSSSLESSAGVI